MIVFGITGGSGAGKTTVSDIFRNLGVYVIDADKAAREVVKKGTECLGEIVRYFGTGILLEDGTLNRKKLGGIVFSDADKLKKLNEITHFHIKIYIEQLICESHNEIIAIDGAVIIGSEIEHLCKFMVSVLANHDIRVKRIMKRDNLSYDDAQQRLAAQPDDDFYKKHSKYIIYNDGEEYELKEKIQKILDDIKR